MKNFGVKLKNLPWNFISLLVLTILFFSFVPILTYDSGHYLSYVAIFEDELPASSWDIVRGPIFPLIIYFFNLLFGKTATGLLVGFFLFYLVFVIICYKLCAELSKNFKHKKIVQNILLAIIILNPLIFGYFHVLLTEFVAITMTILNIYLAYKWIFIKETSKKEAVLYSVYFIFSLLFCYHLKQPYFVIAFTPTLIATILSLIRNHTKKNYFYRIGTLAVSIIFLLVSIFSWNSILKSHGVNIDTGRDSSSMLGKQLLHAYQISHDSDGDGKTDNISTINAIELIFNEFTKNPAHIIKIYLQNYCGLSSTCEIETPNGWDFYSTSRLVGLSTYENTFIGYATYREEANISPMTDEMTARTTAYSAEPNKSIFAKFMNDLKIPTNILFKISALGCLPFLVLLIVIRIKDKKIRYINLFYLNFLLLVTASAHMIAAAGVGLIIDRYAIEIFAPSLLGIFGTMHYARLVLVDQKQQKLKNERKSCPAQKSS